MAYNILIVDDSATTRAFVRRTIALTGFSIGNVHEAGDGRQALELLSANPVDLVVADLHMPGMGGVELTQRILTDDRFRNIPVVVASAEPDSDCLDQLKAAGVKSCLRKPFTPEAFRDALSPFLGGGKHA